MQEDQAGYIALDMCSLTHRLLMFIELNSIVGCSEARMPSTIQPPELSPLHHPCNLPVPLQPLSTTQFIRPSTITPFQVVAVNYASHAVMRHSASQWTTCPLP